MTHFPILHCCYMLFASIQHVSTMTRCPPPSSYVINSLHASKVLFELLYRLQHVLPDPGIPASRHWSMCYLRSAIPYRNHRYVGSLGAPGLLLVRNMLRRRRMGTQSGLRPPVFYSEHRVISC